MQICNLIITPFIGYKILIQIEVVETNISLRTT